MSQRPGSPSDLVELAGVVYGVHVEGRLPATFAPFLRPEGDGPVDPKRYLEVRYRSVAQLPVVEEIWVAEPQEPLTRDRFALFTQPGGFGLAVSSVDSGGIFRIDRRTIAIEWLADGVGAAHFFFSYALPLWLELCGVTVLHASAVARSGRAIAFLGPSGAGKSTLCAELVAAGWEFVADDGLPLEEDEEGNWLCRPGPPWLRLWPSALEGRLGIDAPELGRVRETLDKRQLPVREKGTTNAREGNRLAAVYLIERRRSGEGGGTAIMACPPGESLLRLVEHSLAAAPLAALGLAADRLDRLARVAARVPVRRLRFTAGGDSSRSVREALTGDLGLAGTPAPDDGRR